MPYQLNPFQLAATPEWDTLLCATVQPKEELPDAWTTRYTEAGTWIWGSNTSNTVTEVAADGGSYTARYYTIGGVYYLALIRLKANGSLVWAKRYVSDKPISQIFLTYAPSQKAVYVTAETPRNTATDASYPYMSIYTTLRVTDLGDIVWANRYECNDTSEGGYLMWAVSSIYYDPGSNYLLLNGSYGQVTGLGFRCQVAVVALNSGSGIPVYTVMQVIPLGVRGSNFYNFMAPLSSNEVYIFTNSGIATYNGFDGLRLTRFNPSAGVFIDCVLFVSTDARIRIGGAAVKLPNGNYFTAKDTGLLIIDPRASSVKIWKGPTVLFLNQVASGGGSEPVTAVTGEVYGGLLGLSGLGGTNNPNAAVITYSPDMRRFNRSAGFGYDSSAGNATAAVNIAANRAVFTYQPGIEISGLIYVPRTSYTGAFDLAVPSGSTTAIWKSSPTADNSVPNTTAGYTVVDGVSAVFTQSTVSFVSSLLSKNWNNMPGTWALYTRNI